MKNEITLTVKKYGINGEGIAFHEHKPVFIPGALKEETVLVKIVRNEKNYARAELCRVIHPSAFRRTPSCTSCSACAISRMNEEEQQKFKREILAEALYKYARIPEDLIRQIHTDHIHAGIRSQCKLPVSEVNGQLSTGMYQTGTNHFTEVKSCPMQNEDVERIRIAVLDILNRAHVHAYDPKRETGLRYLIIRSIDHQGQCTLITGKDTIPMELVQELMTIDGLDGLFQSVNTNKNGPYLFGRDVIRLAGSDVIHVSLNGLSLRLSPRSFFQLNVPMASSLYETAIGKIDPCAVLVEAYCGVGAMSLLAHAKADTVIGIENVPEAIANAKQNAADNHIENCHFFCDDAAHGLQEVLAKMPVDTLLADPPRAGMDEAMLAAILSSSIRKIIYVSCNPSTLAKNLKTLAPAYHPVTIIPFDMFPDTPHVESITVLVHNGMHDTKKKKYRKKKKKNAVSLQQGK